MKNYYPIDIVLTAGGQPLAGGNEDFGRKAAVEHRIAKASWGRVAPLQQSVVLASGEVSTAPSHSKQIGAGSFKRVFEAPAKAGGVGVVTDFVLAKLLCANRDSSPPVPNWALVEDAVDDVVKTLVLYGIPRTTVFVKFDFEYGRTIPTLAVYLPRRHGTDLERVVSGRVASDPDLRIRYFVELCRELRQLHVAGYFHGDLKPANVMADPVHGISLIDFGGVNRVWQSPTTTTPAYAIVGPKYEQYFVRTASRLGVALPAALTQALGTARGNLHRVMKAMNAAPMDRYARKRGAGSVTPGLFGAAFDIAAAMTIALELQLFDAATMPLFTQLAEHDFHPSYLEPILELLVSRYAGAVPIGAGAPRLQVLTDVDGIDAVPSKVRGIDPESVAQEVDRRYREQLEQRVAAGDLTASEADARAGALRVVDDAFALHGSLAQLTRLYKRKELMKRENVDTKRRALTAVIDSLTFVHDPGALHAALLKLFALSLVNSGTFSKTHTESFKVLFTWAKSPRVLPLLTKYFDPQLDERTTREAFHGRVLASASVLGGTLGASDGYKTKNRFDAILTVLGDGAAGAGPRDRDAARAAAGQTISAAHRHLLAADGAVTTYATAKGASKATSRGDFSAEVARVASRIRFVFDDLVGTFDAPSFAQFQQDIAAAYAPPSP